MPVGNLHLKVVEISTLGMQHRRKHVRTARRRHHLRRRLVRNPRTHCQLNDVRARLPGVILALLIPHIQIRMRDLKPFARNEQQFPCGQLLPLLPDEEHRLAVTRLRAPQRLAKHHARPRPLRLLRRIVRHQHHAPAQHSQNHSRDLFFHEVLSSQQRQRSPQAHHPSTPESPDFRPTILPTHHPRFEKTDRPPQSRSLLLHHSQPPPPQNVSRLHLSCRHPLSPASPAPATQPGRDQALVREHMASSRCRSLADACHGKFMVGG